MKKIDFRKAAAWVAAPLRTTFYAASFAVAGASAAWSAPLIGATYALGSITSAIDERDSKAQKTASAICFGATALTAGIMCFMPGENAAVNYFVASVFAGAALGATAGGVIGLIRSIDSIESAKYNKRPQAKWLC